MKQKSIQTISKCWTSENDRENRPRESTILCVLQEWPGLRTNEIGEKTKIPVKSIERYVDILKKAGVIYYSGGKNTGGYYLSEHFLRE